MIFSMALSPHAAWGGFVGVMITGIQRAMFSNEAGMGSAAIAHAASKTSEPIREGLVGMLGPFIDTIIVCTLTALVVIITGVWNEPAFVLSSGNVGVTLTAAAFRRVIPWFPYLLTFCIALFAYSSMISWCYYGERGWVYLIDHLGGRGIQTLVVFRITFVLFVLMGATNTLSDVLSFSDAMIFSMAFPNIVGGVILAPQVRSHLRDYWQRYRSGVMDVRGQTGAPVLAD